MKKLSGKVVLPEYQQNYAEFLADLVGSQLINYGDDFLFYFLCKVLEDSCVGLFF